jgi:hypothetical protein
MKRVKLMLTAIAALAVVGGALAFKARNHNVWCGVKGAAINTANCPLYLLKTFTPSTTVDLYCTTTGTKCDTRATITDDN